jgi:hypothetical protein
MTLANMRANGARSVVASCLEIGCGHDGVLNVDHLPDDLPVPDIAASRAGPLKAPMRITGRFSRTHVDLLDHLVGVGEE